MLIPLLKNLDSSMLWLSLASASTLAGNATIIGAMANLIVIESAAKAGVKIGFMEFLKPGAIVTLLSLALSMGILYCQYCHGDDTVSFLYSQVTIKTENPEKISPYFSQ